MPYNINDYSPTYGGIINSSGNVVNSGDTIDATSNVKVSVGQGQTSAQFVFQNNATALGNGNIAEVDGYSTAVVEFIETGSQVISVEASQDSVNWYALPGFSIVGSVTVSSALSATGLYRFNVSGINYIRCRISTWTSGSALVTGYFTSENLLPFGAQVSSSLTSADAVSGSTLSEASAAFNMVSNGTTFDRQRTASNDALAATGITAAGNMIFNGTTWDRKRSASSDALSSTGLQSAGLMGYNGTTWDRIKTAASDALGTTGVLAAGNTIFNGSNYVRQRTADSIFDANAGGLIPATALWGFNGTTFDRVKTINTGQLRTTIYSSTGVEPRGDATTDGSSGTGAIATTEMGWAGATFDRVRVGKVYKYIEYLNLPTSTNTTIWTPAAGKKFRLMGISIATSATVHLHIRDSGTIFHSVRLQGTTTSFEFGNGYLSAVANNLLEVRNDSGTTTNVWITAWGTEE